MVGELPDEIYLALHGPPPAWPWTIEPDLHSERMVIPEPEVIRSVFVASFPNLPTLGFAIVPPHLPGSRAEGVPVAWQRDDLVIVMAVPRRGLWFMAVGPRDRDRAMGDALGSAWELFAPGARTFAFGGFPVAGADADTFAASLAPFAREFEAHLAPLLASAPVDLVAFQEASAAVTQRLRDERYLAHAVRRAEAAWRDGRYATFLDYTEQLESLGMQSDPDRVRVARAHPDQPLELPDDAPRDRAGRLRAAVALFRSVDVEMDEAIAHRWDGPTQRATWEETARRWHQAMELVWEVGALEPAAIRSGDPDAIDAAITYLEVDPWMFRSGYVKDDLLRALRQVDLGPIAAERLRAVVLAIVDAGDRREFRGYCRLARRIADESLVAALRERLRGDDPGRMRRSFWMLEALRVEYSGDERARIRALLEEQAANPDDDHWYRAQPWVGAAVRRHGDEAWVRSLVDRAFSMPVEDLGALRLLTSIRVTITDAQRRVLQQLELDRIATGGDLSWLEALALVADDPEFRAALIDAYRAAPDSGTRTRAWWAINAIRRTTDGGWPGEMLDA